MGKKQVLKRNYDKEGNLISKECSCCHKIKPVSEFNKNKRDADGLVLKCKECLKQYYQENKESKKEYMKEYNQKNKEHIKEYNQKNKERIKEYKKIYRQENKDKIKEYHREYWQENKDDIKEQRKKYYQENKDKIYEKNREYYQKYWQENKDDIYNYLKERRGKKIEEALQQIKMEVEADPNKYNYIEGKEIFGIIYLVHNIKSDKYYIGQTTIGFDNRYPSGWLYEHGYKNAVKEDLDLYGENSFEYIKLFKVAHSQYELDKLEAYYIDYYNSYENGYNENRGNIFTDRGKEK